jgi:hypothetical protein
VVTQVGPVLDELWRQHCRRLRCAMVEQPAMTGHLVLHTPHCRGTGPRIPLDNLALFMIGLRPSDDPVRIPLGRRRGPWL